MIFTYLIQAFMAIFGFLIGAFDMMFSLLLPTAFLDVLDFVVSSFENIISSVYGLNAFLPIDLMLTLAGSAIILEGVLMLIKFTINLKLFIKM